MSRISTEELAQQAQSGDNEAIMALWERVRHFCYKQARRWRPQDADDLGQAGMLALYRALPYYSPDEGTFIGVYARALKGEFLTAIFGGRSAKQLADPLNTAISYDVPLTSDKGDEGDELIDFIADPTDLEAEAERKDAREAVLAALQSLEERERVIIRLRYYCTLTQGEAAKRAKITLREAKRLEASALRKLRAPAISKELKKYI